MTRPNRFNPFNEEQMLDKSLQEEIKEKKVLSEIADIAHKAVNGGLALAGRAPRISDYKDTLRHIRELALNAAKV